MLRLDKVTKRFGSITALNSVSLDLADRTITGLAGPNGSGKTVLIQLVTGFCRPDEGKIFFDEREIENTPPYRISRMGVIRTFQHPRICPDLSVLDNLMAAAPNQTGERLTAIFLRPGRIRREERHNREEAEEILEMLDLKMMRDERAGRLNFCRQKLLELGRSIMAHPRIVILDEPTAGIHPSLIERMFSFIRQQSRKGVRFLLIEHNLPLAADLCEHLFVIDRGTLIYSGSPDKAADNEHVAASYGTGSVYDD